MTENNTQFPNLDPAYWALKGFGAKFLPLARNSKKPVAKFADRMNEGDFFTDQDINDHLAKGGNLAIMSRPNFIFIDIDVSHEVKVLDENSIPVLDENGEPTYRVVDGKANFKNWLAEHGMDYDALMANTLTATTATGGTHLVYYQPENGERLSQVIKFIEGVDIKASPNNFIVVYPTVVPVQQPDGTVVKQQYQWNNANTPIEIPAPLLQAIQEHNKTTRRKKKNVISSGEEVNGVSYYRYDPYKENGAKIDIFKVILNGWGDQGSRNDNIFAWGQQMRYATDLETALHFADIANENSDDPMPVEEYEATITSAYEYAGQPKDIREIIAKNGTVYKFIQLTENVDSDELAYVPLSVYRARQSYNFDAYKDDELFFDDMVSRADPNRRALEDYEGQFER